MDTHVIEQSPFDRIKIKKRNSTKSIKFFNIEDVHKILFHAQNDPFGLAVFFLLYTGLRKGELCALNWEDIDLEEKCIYVNKTVRYSDTGYYLHNSTKTNNDRCIPISSKLLIEIYKVNIKKGFVIGSIDEFCTLNMFDSQYRMFFKRLNNSLEDNEVKSS